MTKPATTFRLVLSTQIHENYGAHDWDGKGECPQYWKAKGGSEYHVSIGDVNDCIALGQEGRVRLLALWTAKIATDDDYYQEYVIDWNIVGSDEETHEEQEMREMRDEGYLTQEQYDHRFRRLQQEPVA